MKISPNVRRIVFISLAFACLCVSIVAQDKSFRGKDPFSHELWTNSDPEFIKKHSIGPAESSTMTGGKVRFIYLVPSDRTERADYKAAIADAALHLQDYYQKELGSGYTFELNDPIVEVYNTSHTANWYQTNNAGGASQGWYAANAFADGFSATGGGYNDPNNRWIFFLDAEVGCLQYTGGNAGVALMHAGDLRGLNGESYLQPCPGDPIDTSGKLRYIGGVGHEVGHSFNLPHPPGCGTGSPWAGCTGGSTAYFSLMYVGYVYYPGTYFLAQDKTDLMTYTNFISVHDLRKPKFVDFDADRQSDLSYFRPSNGNWYINASTAGTSTVYWGLSGDTLVPGDYDGDRKTDTALWRSSDQTWYIVNSATNTYSYLTYGVSTDIPVPADYDGDRITDTAVWRPSSATWYINRSASGTEWIIAFGVSTDRPVPADYDGDKRADLAVFRPGSGDWYIHKNYLSYYYYTSPPANGNVIYTVTNYGVSSDKNVPADYDGDGKDDIAVWRASTGDWYYLSSLNSSSNQHSIGQSGDIPVPGDYDNDDIIDFAVWRSSNGYWYIHPTGGGRNYFEIWGSSGDIPVESAYVR